MVEECITNAVAVVIEIGDNGTAFTANVLLIKKYAYTVALIIILILISN